MNLASWKYEAIKLPRCLPLAQTDRLEGGDVGGREKNRESKELIQREGEKWGVDRENRAI